MSLFWGGADSTDYGPITMCVAMAQRWHATRSESRGSKHVQRPGDPVDPVDLSHGGLFQKIDFHENPERTHADGFGYCHVLPPWTTLSSDDWKGISVKRSEMDSEFGLCIVRHHTVSNTHLPKSCRNSS